MTAILKVGAKLKSFILLGFGHGRCQQHYLFSTDATCF